MVDYNKEARKAKREGDYSKAGDLYYLAGDEKNAMEMYLEGNHFALAARLLEKNEDWKGAAKYYMQSGKYRRCGRNFLLISSTIFELQV